MQKENFGKPCSEMRSFSKKEVVSFITKSRSFFFLPFFFVSFLLKGGKTDGRKKRSVQIIANQDKKMDFLFKKPRGGKERGGE